MRYSGHRVSVQERALIEAISTVFLRRWISASSASRAANTRNEPLKRAEGVQLHRCPRSKGVHGYANIPRTWSSRRAPRSLDAPARAATGAAPVYRAIHPGRRSDADDMESACACLRGRKRLRSYSHLLWRRHGSDERLNCVGVAAIFRVVLWRRDGNRRRQLR